jgi:hypothetical protein
MERRISPMSTKIRSMKLVGTTDADGDATIDGECGIGGRLIAVEWVDGDLEDGVDAVLTMQGTPSGVAHTLLTLTDANSDAIYYPRTLIHSETGVALTGTSGGDRETYMIMGVPRLVITDGGDTKTGGVVLYYTE